MARQVGRIRRQTTFRALSRPDGRARRGQVSVVFSRTTEVDGMPVAGYAIGRRYGSAVARNRVRRRLREAVSSVAPDLEAGAYLLRVTPTAGELPFDGLCAAVRAAAHDAAAGSPRERREGGR